MPLALACLLVEAEVYAAVNARIVYVLRNLLEAAVLQDDSRHGRTGQGDEVILAAEQAFEQGNGRVGGARVSGGIARMARCTDERYEVCVATGLAVAVGIARVTSKLSTEGASGFSSGRRCRRLRNPTMTAQYRLSRTLARSWGAAQRSARCRTLFRAYAEAPGKSSSSQANQASARPASWIYSLRVWRRTAHARSFAASVSSTMVQARRTSRCSKH